MSSLPEIDSLVRFGFCRVKLEFLGLVIAAGGKHPGELRGHGPAVAAIAICPCLSPFNHILHPPVTSIAAPVM